MLGMKTDGELKIEKINALLSAGYRAAIVDEAWSDSYRFSLVKDGKKPVHIRATELGYWLDD